MWSERRLTRLSLGRLAKREGRSGSGSVSGRTMYCWGSRKRRLNRNIPKGSLAGHLHLSRLKDAPAAQVSFHPPGADLVPHQPHTPATGVARQVRNFRDLQPGLGHTVAVDYPHVAFQVSAHLPAGSQALQPYVYTPEADPGPDKANGQHQGDDVEQPVEERKSRGDGVEDDHGQ